MATKKQVEEFNARMSEVLKKHGAKITEYSMRTEFEIMSKFGLFTYTLHAPERTEIYAIFGRFNEMDDSLKQDSTHLNCKRNIYGFTDVECVNQVDAFLDSICNLDYFKKLLMRRMFDLKFGLHDAFLKNIEDEKFIINNMTTIFCFNEKYCEENILEIQSFIKNFKL